MEGRENVYNRKYSIECRKDNRGSLTKAEAKLWLMLKGRRFRGRKFRRQHSIADHIVDFYCPSEKLIIELDSQVHKNLGVELSDIERDNLLFAMGFRIIRIANKYVFEQPENVLAVIGSFFKGTD